MTIKDKAYSAGLFDGEGYIGIGYGGITIEIRLISTNLKAIKWLEKRWGGSFYKRKKIKNRRQAYDWILRREKDVGEFINAIYPFLIIKKDQINRAFKIKNEMLELRTPRGIINSLNVHKRWEK